MLDRLDTIDWNEIERAHGPAGDVPRDLRALTMGKAADRNKAWSRLVDRLNHQGTPTPAAFEAAPFLIELAAAAEVEDRARILVLLANLATGGDHAGYSTDGYPALPPDPNEPLDELHARVGAGREAFVALLGDKAAAVRAAAALVLAFLPEHADETAVAMRGRLASEKDATARASALIALALLVRALKSDEDRALFARESASAAEGSLAAVASAVALVYTSSPLPAAAREALLGAIRKPPKATDFPWNGGDVRGFAVRVLVSATTASRDFELLRSLLDVAEGEARVDIAASLFRSVLGGLGPDAEGYPRPGAGLSAEGRDVLALLHERRLLEPLRYLLREHGLVPFVPEIARTAGLAPAGPLDREMEGAPAWLHIRRALDGRAPMDAWFELAKRSLTADEAIALARDAGAGAYHLHEPWPPAQVPQHVAAEHEGRLASLLTRTLEAPASATVVAAYAAELAAPERHTRERAAAMIALARLLRPSGAIVDERFDPLIKRAMNDAYHADMREVLATLPIARREPLILAWPLVSANVGDQLVGTQGWRYVDLSPTAAIGEKVIDEVITAPYGPPPAELAARVLAAVGEPIAPRLRALVASGAKNAEVLRDALAAIEGSRPAK